MTNSLANPLTQFSTMAQLPTSGQFYCIPRNLANSEVRAWLKEIRVNSVTDPTASAMHYEVVQQTAIISLSGAVANSKLSYVVFEDEVEPVFWDPPHPGAPSLLERRYGYCLICEIEISTDYFLFIQRLHAANPLPHINDALDPKSAAFDINPLSPYQFMEPWIKEDTRIERLSLRPMSLSTTALRKKTLEASDVRRTLSTLGIQRVVPGGLQIKGTSNHATALNLTGRFSLMPKTQRLAQKGDRKRIDDLVDWVARAAAAFKHSKSASKYPIDLLRSLAQPSATLAGETADSLLIECQTLLDRQASKQLQIYWRAGKSTRPCSDIIDTLDESIALTPLTLASGRLSNVTFSGTFSVAAPSGKTLGAKVTVNNATVSLDLVNAADYSVVDRIEYPDGSEVPLSTYIAEQKLYRVSMSGGKKLYCSEGAFTETKLGQSADQLLEIFEAMHGAAAVTSEKGVPKPNNKNFPAKSSFKMIVDNLRHKHALVCDDSLKEKCDFLAVEATGNSVQWLHAKVKGTKSGKATSASNLQDVVGQAIKNLAYLRFTKTQAISAKKRSFWSSMYKLPMNKTTTKIPRFVPNGAIATIDNFLDQLELNAINPHTRYSVAIVVPTLSKSYLKTEFAKLGSKNTNPEVVQMFWLLSGFMQSCLEVNAKPIVYCRA